jgi:phospholipid-binding lipoprotein MlaA
MRGLVSVLTIAACLAAPTVASAQDATGQEIAPAVAAEAQAEAEPTLALENTDPRPSYDPWEGFNRAMFGVHRAVDNAVLEPVARGYRAITPRPVRGGVRNFLRNLNAPVIFANDLLQGEFKRAGSTAGRFAINSTVGIAGILDPATSIGLERHDEDFGQTLAVWGVPSGPYLFLPLLGPSNIRDSAGRGVDIALDPITWSDFDEIDTFRASRTVLGAISAREGLLDPIDAIEAQGGDLYITYRSAYEVSREAAIQNGRTDVQDLPDFEMIDENPETQTPDGGETAPEPEANPQQEGAIQPAENSVVFSETLAAPTSLGQ